MALEIWSLEWLNANTQRNYPLALEATGLDTSGSFRIPENFIVDLDLQIPVSLDVQPAKFFVRNIGSYATGYSVVIGYSSTAGDVNVASALIARQGFVKNEVFRLEGIGDFEDAIGSIVIGTLTGVDEQPSGFFEFTLTTGRLEAAPISPQIRGLGALVAVSGGDRSERLQQEIEFVAGSNMRITAIPSSGPGIRPQIRFDAIDGEGLTEDCVCENTGLGPPIRTINGIGPTLSGDFTVLGSECLEIDGITNGLRLTDVCSEPCCGCPELERVTTDLSTVQRENRSLGSFLNLLGASVTQMDQVILGSRLSDRGCFPTDG